MIKHCVVIHIVDHCVHRRSWSRTRAALVRGKHAAAGRRNRAADDWGNRAPGDRGNRAAGDRRKCSPGDRRSHTAGGRRNRAAARWASGFFPGCRAIAGGKAARYLSFQRFPPSCVLRCARTAPFHLLNPRCSHIYYKTHMHALYRSVSLGATRSRAAHHVSLACAGRAHSHLDQQRHWNCPGGSALRFYDIWSRFIIDMSSVTNMRFGFINITRVQYIIV